MEEDEVGKLLLRESAPDRRLRIFAALLAKESGLGTDGMTVVGRSAIEIYTEGSYLSEDIDLVVDSRAQITTALARWGFRDHGKGWSKQEWGLFVDPMQTPMSGSRRHTQVVSTPFGPFRISGIEDLIIRRVRESVAWQNREEAFAHAVLLVEFGKSEIDWEYLDHFARREGWERQLAELRRRAKRSPTSPKA
ncbi:MAG: hypothetical protein WB789_01355 [Thermoplasmata archaeon]